MWLFVASRGNKNRIGEREINPIGIERKRYLLIDCLGVYDHPLLLLWLCSLLSNYESEKDAR